MCGYFNNRFIRNCFCFLFVIFLLICCTTKKQEIKDNIMFLDIPISGNVLDFANQLEQKGFKKDSHFNGILNNKLYGVYDGCPCTLVIGHSVNNEVLSVFIRFHQSYEIMQMDESTKESFINMEIKKEKHSARDNKKETKNCSSCIIKILFLSTRISLTSSEQVI